MVTWSVSVLTGTAQRIRSGAKRAAQRERGQPGGAEQVVSSLRAPTGPPEPEAEDQARDEIEGREQCFETGEAFISLYASASHTGFLTLTEQLFSLIPPFLFSSSSPWSVFVGDIKATVPGEQAEK